MSSAGDDGVPPSPSSPGGEAEDEERSEESQSLKRSHEEDTEENIPKRPRVEPDDAEVSSKDSDNSQSSNEGDDKSIEEKGDLTNLEQGDEKESEISSQKQEIENGVNNSEILDLSVGNKKEKQMSNDTNDSDKENETDAPIDLSTKSSTEKSPDVIMLSDSDSEDSISKIVELIELSPEEVIERKKLIIKLQAELRNEEAKLVLLKKIRQSQLASQQGNDMNKMSATGQQRPGVGMSSVSPLIRSNQPVAGNKYPSPTPQHMRAQQPILSQGGPSPLMSQQRQSSHHHSMSSSQMPGYRPQSQSTQPQHPSQTPEQRQAAAKLALRKQLEKTLLQIPPPKPPPPEMNFIPSVGSNEFIMLVGLEEIVKRILDTEQGKPEVKYVFNPFTCCQCTTDFTPVWKRNKPGSKDVICETCVTSNTKRALKQEHTNRLKSAFVKALQQEQEIEQRMQTSSGSASSAAPLSAATSSPVNLSSSYKPSAEQLRQHQNLLQAHQAQLRNMALYPYQLQAAFGGGKSALDLQRKYLMEMMPQGSWKK